MPHEKPIVAVTRKIPEAGLKLLAGKFELKVSPVDRVLEKSELAKFVKGASAILSLLTDKIDGSIMDAAGKNLKLIANYAVGFDNVDLAAAKKRKITVTNTPGVLTEAVAEHTFALLMAVARRIVESDKFMRSGNYTGWEPELLLGPELTVKTFGILGLGRIGSRVAEIASGGYQMKVIYYDRGNKDRDLDKRLGAEAVTIRKLLTSADFISLHVPLTSETHHLIGKSELSSMKKTAILINTSRGPVIDELALAWALKHGEIWGAGIDVFEFEPKLTSELRTLDNIVVTPHTASATSEARAAMAVLAAKNILQVLEGRPALTPVK